MRHIDPWEYIGFFIQYAFLLFAASIHESSHAWTAYRLGDPTAKMQNRISLNPANHIDILGTVIIPFVAFLSGFPILGWAKPTPVNPNNFANPRSGNVFVSGAGPVSNLICAVILAALWHGSRFLVPSIGTPGIVALQILGLGIVVNLVLAVFNMLPIYPLDGSGVLEGLLPLPLARAYARLRPFGFILLLVLFYTPPFKGLIGSVISFLAQLLGVRVF
jgi:Zn-dependent protease